MPTNTATTITTTTVGGRIRESRKSVGLTQSELAEACHVTREHIARIEVGTGNPSIVLLVRIADALNVSLTDLTSDLRVKERRRGRTA